VDGDLFRVVVELECHKAVRLQYCVSAVVLTLDVQSGADSSSGETSPLDEIAKEVARELRATDLVAVLSSSEVGLLLIDAEATDLVHVVERVKRSLSMCPQPREWRASGACFPMTVSRGSLLLAQAGHARDQGEELSQ
jgi:hypothetical protein